MKISFQGPRLLIKNADTMQFALIKSWNCMKWDRKAKALCGMANLELLDKLARLVPLPADLEARRDRLRAVQDAVDRERVRISPTPLYNYPVTMPLYTHQVRAANMALLGFGWVEEEARHE